MENYYSDKIIQMLSDSIFELSLEELKLVYSDFKKEKHPLISANKTKGLYKKHLTSYQYSDKQFDLPHFIKGKGASKKTIMIIGMDAKSDRRKGDVLLSTPYNLHHSDAKATKKNQYWDIIKILLGKYNIYLTDLYKSYFVITELDGSRIISNTIQSYTQNPIHKNLLESEIETVNPEGILCWGKDSRTAASELLEIKLKDSRISYDDVREGYTISNKKTKFISTPHPSQLTRPKTWLTFYNINLPGKDPSDHYNRPKFLSELIMNAIK